MYTLFLFATFGRPAVAAALVGKILKLFEKNKLPVTPKVCINFSTLFLLYSAVLDVSQRDQNTGQRPLQRHGEEEEVDN